MAQTCQTNHKQLKSNSFQRFHTSNGNGLVVGPLNRSHLDVNIVIVVVIASVVTTIRMMKLRLKSHRKNI